MFISETALPSICSGLIQRLLHDDDIEALLNFRRNIFASLANPDLVLPEIDEMGWCLSRLGSEGKCIGLFKPNGELVAYASMYLPSQNSDDEFISLIDIPQKLWGKVAIIDSCMVHPDFRGNGIQRALIHARCEKARKLDRPLCFSLASLLNNASRHNLMSCGFSICWIGETSPNRIRQILARDLSTKTIQESEVIWVPVTSIDQQLSLLSKGYRGYFEKLSSPTEIGYVISGETLAYINAT